MSRYPSSLTTAQAIHRQLLKADPSVPLSTAQAQFDEYFAYIREVVPQVSSFIEGETGRSLTPYKETKTLYFADLARQGDYDPRRRLLTLPEDLLVVSSITWISVVLSATDYRLVTDDRGSAWAITFNPSTSLDWSSEFNDGIIIDAIWGYHDSLGQMWTTVDASITIADGTTATVTVAASSSYEVWQYVRIEAEYMQITNLPSATTLTVTRGVNGTTAAAHTAQALQTYMPVKDIRMAATRLGAFMYQKRSDLGGVVQIGDASFRLDSMPPAVKEAITRRRKLTWGSV